MSSSSSMHKAGHSKPVHWDNPERGWRWEGGSGWGETFMPMADSCQCMAKATTVL